MGRPVEVLAAAPAEPSTSQGICAGPTTGTERDLVEVLAGVVGIERVRVSVDSHFFNDLGADSMVMARFCARVRKRPDLPAVSMTDVYQHPTIRSLAAALAPPSGSTVDERLVEVLAGVVGVERVSVDSHFFNDLGADSMVMARFCARVRKRPDLPAVSMTDVYRHPTIRSLTAALAPPGSAPAEPAAMPVEEPTPASTPQYVLCGVLQLLIICGYAYVAAVGFTLSFDWIYSGRSLTDLYLRSSLASGAFLLGTCLLPIAAKWMLVGRWRPEQIRVWSLTYLRFWVVRTLVTLNPLVLFAGSPIYNLYLRALGARIGRGVLILSRHAPVCTDLLTIGAGTVIRNHAYFSCYHAEAGVLRTGPVVLGRDAFVGETSVLDIETSMGDGAQLGHASSLHAGQEVPAGERWHGSPAQPTRSDYRRIEPADYGTYRRVTFTLAQIAQMFLVVTPLVGAVLVVALREVPWLHALFEPGSRALADSSFLVFVLATSLGIFVGSMLLGFLAAVTVPRALNLALEPGKVYPLYGFRYAAHRAIARLTNRKFFLSLFGDSSYIVYYLRSIGYRLTPVVQTGSNFGSLVEHENPYLCVVGSGTVVADGLHLVNAEYSSTSFRVSRTRIGANNFLGNQIVYPAQGSTGDNCLLATKVLVPIDGEVREGVGLLGSPSFEIPRTVARDNRFGHLMVGDEFRRRLAAKNRHNLATMAYWLLVRWGYTFALTLFALLVVDLYADLGAVAIASGEVIALAFTLAYNTLVERASTGFRGMKPKYCSIYQADFWRTERFFKMMADPGPSTVLVGTPLRSWFWRMLGVRLGKRLFDDGCGIVEKNLVAIGDDVTLNAGAVIQCHSQEDYTFKSDRITVGSGCTVGVGALVHYGVTMGDGSVLAPDSFLMKGEEVPPNERWGGNPARPMLDDKARTPVRRSGDGDADPVSPR